LPEENLRAKIDDLEEEIKSKDREIYDYHDRIDQLENTIMKLESLLPEEDAKTSKDKKQKLKESKLEIDLTEKDNQIRDLKNRMGFLRKEKTQLQRELEKYTKKETGSTIIRIEEKKEPLEILVKDLQDKIRKQNNIISKLEKNIEEIDGDSLKTRLLHNESKFKNLKKLMDFKDQILDELLKQIQSHKSLLKDSQIQLQIKTIQDLNEKISKHLNNNF